MLPPPPREDTRLDANLTPMIDVLFQLLIFFLCATKFRLLDGRLATFLPDRGEPSACVTLREELRLVLRQDAGSGATRVLLGERTLHSEDEIRTTVAVLYDEFRRVGTKVDVLLESDPSVPVQAVVTVMNACIRAGISDVGFAASGG